MKFLTFVFLFFISSCSRQYTIGLNPHQFNATPRNIIWLQIPGLTNEHLALLRFGQSSALHTTAFEEMTCSGALWAFNLEELRPKAKKSYLSQMSSHRLIPQGCDNLPEENIFTYLSDQGYLMGLYEYGARSEQSIESVLDCGTSSAPWREGVHYWLSKQTPSGGEYPFFHFQDSEQAISPGVYYDQTCQGRRCFADFNTNVNSLWNRLRGDRGRVLYIIRDFSYLNALLEQDITKARERLTEIEKVVATFTRDPDLMRDTLVLVTSAQGIQFEFPSQGQQWREFEESGRHAFFRHSTLVSPVFSWGVRGENFCGQYPESQILGRILFSPRDLSTRERVRRLF